MRSWRQDDLFVRVMFALRAARPVARRTESAMKDPHSPQYAAQAAAKPTAFHPSPISTTEGKVARRTGALFKALATDFLLREQFVTDPSQVLGEFVLGERPSAEAGDAANQLVYAVMSNPRLRNWLGAYARHKKGTAPLRDEFAQGFAKAVARFGDDATVLSLIRGASADDNHFALQADLLRSIVGLIGAGGRVSSGTEMSPGATGGTEQSGTHMSPGAIFSGTEMSPGLGTEMSGTHISPGAIFSGTEMSPGFGTEMSGTHMSPGAIFSGTEMSPGFGTEMSGTHMSPGAIFSGTEMSPGTGGTEMSPGTGGTEMSPGAAGGWQLPAHLQISFAALVQYANLLRARGALHRSGLEGR
jgi:hypothetical protein